MKTKYDKLLIGASVLSLLATDAFAQQKGMDEIVVTARKRAESMQDVPVSIAAISADTLGDQKIRDGVEIAAMVPNLSVTNTVGDGFPIFSLRGVSMSDFSLNQSSPVASYVDEVYKGLPAIQGVQIFDLERVEVLRGPQGTLYGKNSTGGAVNFITKQPGFETDGHITLGYGNNNRFDVEGAFQLPIAEDRLAVRIAGVYRKADGWQKNHTPGVEDGSAVDEYGIRISALASLTPKLEAILRYTTSKQDAVNYGIVPFNIDPAVMGYTRPSTYDFTDFASGQDTKRRIKTDAAVLTLNWDISDAFTLTSISSWDKGDFWDPEDAEGAPGSIIEADYYAEAEQFAQDLRITSNLEGPFNFIAGLYYSDEDAFNETTLGFYTDVDANGDGNTDSQDCLDTGFLGCAFRNNFDQNKKSTAGYFDGNYEVSGNITLRGGLRYTKDEGRQFNYRAYMLGAVDNVPLASLIPGHPTDPLATIAPQEYDTSEWAGRVGLDYKTEAGHLLYGSYSKGYRSGAFNAQAFFDPSEYGQVEPEKLDSFEIGFKSQFAGNTIRLNGSAFLYKYKNQQFLDVDPVTTAQNLINIDKSTMKGLELELVMQPTDVFRLSAGLGLLETEVDEGVLSGVDLAGNELLLAPGVNFNAAMEYDVFSGDKGDLTVKLDSHYTGSHYFEVFNTDRLQQDGYWLFGGRVNWQATENWGVGAWIRNAFDQEYRTSAIDLQGFGFDYSHVGQTRSFGVDVFYDF